MNWYYVGFFVFFLLGWFSGLLFIRYAVWQLGRKLIVVRREHLPLIREQEKQFKKKSKNV